jgi:hypothetical protein
VVSNVVAAAAEHVVHVHGQVVATDAWQLHVEVHAYHVVCSDNGASF